jgi:mutator protein MutT
VFFHNTAAAVGIILRVRDHDDAILLLRRGNEPSRGMLDFPGGFVDPGESAEDALRRELREEIGVDATDVAYLVSQPNRYEYRDVVYSTCDLIFTGAIERAPRTIQRSEIAGYEVVPADDVDIETIAFPSLRHAFRFFLLHA